MSLFTDPPRVSKTSFRKGDKHLGVWALQRFLNTVYKDDMGEDGNFGPRTERAVKRYQADTGAKADGVVGPETSLRLVRSAVVRAPHGKDIPKGLVEGQIDGESGRQIAAVNSQVPGGLDLGLTQRRVYGPPFNTEAVKAAMDPVASVGASVDDLYTNWIQLKRSSHNAEYNWRVAMLAHNWPWAAQQLANGNQLPLKRATTKDIIGYRANGEPIYGWIPLTAKFKDGAPVVTYRDWAAFYAMGSLTHKHPGIVTSLAYGVPTWG